MPTIPASSFVPAASTLISNNDFPRSLSTSQASAPTVAVSSQAVQALASSQKQESSSDALKAARLRQELRDVQREEKQIVRELDELDDDDGTSVYA